MIVTNIKYRAISQEDIVGIYQRKSDKFYQIVEDAFSKYDRGEVILPTKIMKWVSVFPTNASQGLQNVSGIMVLSEIETGFPIAVIDGTLLTNIRTAAVGCVAAKYLAPSKVETIGFIGAGSEAKMHFALLKHMFPTIKECRVSSRKAVTEETFIGALQDATSDVKFVACGGDSFKAANDADIVITAISGQAPVLKAKDITKGCLYIHVGGWEDEFAVVEKADKIVCDEWDSCKHRTQTISRMYAQGLLKDEDIYAAENAYVALENALNEQINQMKANHSDYDEFQFQIDEIGHNPYQLISYLTVKYGGFTYAEVADEIQEIFKDTIIRWFDDSVAKWDCQALFQAVWSGDSVAITREMTTLLRMTISYHDYREDFYHAFLAGIFAGAGYEVESNKEHGEGRSDVVVYDSVNGRVAIFEAKYSKTLQDMTEDCKRAIRQISDRMYAKDFQDDYDQICCYGISFYKKRCMVMCAEGEQVDFPESE